MTLDLERTTLVIVGAWNQAIFTEDFVRQNVFKGPASVTMDIGLTPGGLLPRFSGSGFRLLVQPDRIVWTPTTADEAQQNAIELSALRLLGKLSVTPIRAVGVNIGLTVLEPTEALSKELSLDEGVGFSGLGANIRAATLKRSFSWRDRILNLSISIDRGSPTLLDVNFHKDVVDADSASKAIRKRVLDARRVALSLVESVYGHRLTKG